jgi:hypothetical protein
VLLFVLLQPGAMDNARHTAERRSGRGRKPRRPRDWTLAALRTAGLTYRDRRLILRVTSPENRPRNPRTY